MLVDLTIARSSTDDPKERAQFPDNQARILQRGDPDRQIDSFLHDIDAPIKQLHVKGDARMVDQKSGEQRKRECSTEQGRAANT